MSLPKTICLTGFPGCGKDTLADALVKYRGYRKVAFATPLKEALLKIDPVYQKLADLQPGNWTAMEMLEACKRNGTEQTREKLQNLGSFLRGIKADYFVEAAYRTILSEERIVFSDCRYQNEVLPLEGREPFIVAVHRDGYGPVNRHESEGGTHLLIQGCHLHVHNSGTDPDHLFEAFEDEFHRHYLDR